MSTLTTEDWTKMRELVTDVVDLRLAATEKRFLSKDDAKNFATKDDLKQFATKDELMPIRESIKAINENLKAINENLKVINSDLKLIHLRLDHMEGRWEKVEIKLENLFENDQDNRQRIHRLEHGLEREAN